jgi:hypothetical protein
MELMLAGQAVIKNLNVRAEQHDEDRVLAVDLKLSLTTDCNALAVFSPTLRSLLYTEADAPEFRTLRVPDLKPLQLTTEAEYHVLNIGALTVDNVTCTKFEIAPENYGRVVITFTVSISDFDPDGLPDVARLFLDQTVSIDIEPMQASLPFAKTGTD